MANQYPYPEHRHLNGSEVKIFVVAVGTSIDGIDEMVQVASNPLQKFLFRVKNSTDSCKLLS